MKKFLALVLALVMTMSLVTISAGAEDFTDDASITYEEAVDVMTAAGVVGGYADGSFNPTAGLTRGAAAKIICNMLLGPTTAEALTANDAPFADVAVDNVFAGYIAYCVNEGIISGYADGTFKPAAPLTGYAFMKMLLGALGYDADIEGYTGSNWSIQVAKRALNVGLDNGLEGTFVGNKALTREEACLYAFNAMKADMVKYDQKSTISVGDIVISQNSDAAVITGDKNGDAIWDEVTGSVTVTTLQFAEKYFSDLQIGQASGEDADAFGRPAITWYYDNEKVGTYAETADKVMVMADADLNATTVLTDVDYFNYKAAKVSGVGSTDVALNGYTGGGATIALNKGDTVEVFEDATGAVDKVVVIRTALAVIDDVKEPTKAQAKKDISTVLELDYFVGGSVGTYVDDTDGTEKILAGFDAETYVEDAIIAIVENPNTHAIIDSYIPEMVTGKVTSFTTNSFVKVDGTKYTFVTAYTPGTSYDFDADQEIYLSTEGYVLGIDAVSSAALTDVYFVHGVWASVGSKGTTYKAELVALDGTVSEVALDYADVAAMHAAFAVGASWDGSWADIQALAVKADADDDGKDTLAIMAKGDEYAGYTLVNVASITESIKANATYVDFGSVKTYVNADTNYLAVEIDEDLALTTKTAVGGMKYGYTGSLDLIFVFADTDAKKTATHVLYVSDDLTQTVATDDIVYVKSVSTEDTDDSNFINDLYMMADNSLVEDVVVDTASNKFFSYSIVDGVYELTSAGSAIAADVDDDTTGYITNLVIAKGKYYGDQLSGVANANFEDVSFGDATIIDARTEAEIAADAYEFEITSVGALKDALDLGGVKVDAFVTDGEITFICILTASDK